MAGQAHTVRSARTRAALRQAAVTRFLADGVEATSIEDIAADAGVTVRTFYRHFTSKHDLLFADYDAGLHWFRAALAARPAGEPVIESVQAAIFTFPYDVQAISQLGALRVRELDQGRIAKHLRRVEADLAAAIADHLTRAGARPPATADEHLAIAVTSRAIAAATFGAMETWIVHSDRSMSELARLCHQALDQLASALESPSLV
jgi:AcrR family transcriptional regulator